MPALTVKITLSPAAIEVSLMHESSHNLNPVVQMNAMDTMVDDAMTPIRFILDSLSSNSQGITSGRSFWLPSQIAASYARLLFLTF